MGKDDKELEKVNLDTESSNNPEADQNAARTERVLQVLKEDSNILGDYIQNDAEAKRELGVYQQEVRGILEGSKEKIDAEIVDRAQRDIYFADEVEKMAKGEEFNAPALAGVLERRMWGSFFNNLKKGDTVISFLVPGADFLSIKNLNDKIFGPQITNRIIEQKRIVLEQKIKEVDPNASLARSDYNIEVIQTSKDPAVYNKQLEKVMTEVDREITKFIEVIIDKLIEKERESLEPFIIKRAEHQFIDKNAKKSNDELIKKYEDNINKWDQFKQELLGTLNGKPTKGGFRMNYGLAVVEGNEAKDQLLALNHSLQTSRVAREKRGEIYGAEYSENKNLQEVENIKNLRDEIIKSGNKITDLDGNEFTIFLPVPVEGATNRYTLDRDLLRDVRKGKFKIVDKSLLEKVVLYIKRLNILDAVKPFIYAETKTVGENIERFHELAEKIKNQELSDEDRQKAADILRSDEKAPEYTSKSEFHKRAAAMEDAVYVSMDVLDLGVDLLLEYESALQDVENAPSDKKLEKFNEVSLVAGDETTKKLREFRKEVVRVYKEEFGLGDGLVVGEVGGDELTLAIDIKDLMKGEVDEKQKEEKLNKLLFALKKATNTRVIKTVVSETEKHVSNESDQHGRVEAHLKAIKRAEAGASIAKDLEEAARKLTRLLNRLGKEAVTEKLDGLREVFMIEGNEVKSNFVIMDNDGGFKIANGDDGEFNYNSIKKDLDAILGKKEY
ncbi:MAG: hypothetical protein HYT15_01695 [Candidatus Magasanikbacteria bacterium]|nr:hypothetical protein [Candidatus Magasanikbacteria bacterium]